MRRVIFFIAAVLTAAAALWSCQPEESRTSASVLKPVTIGEVVIPSSGGTSAFIYMIENPVEGGELSLEVPGDASWIVSTDISVQDTVLITAAPNPDTLSRSTTLTLNYESTFLLIKVLQRGTEMGEGGFAFNVTDVKTTMATVEVYPADKEMTYVAFSVAKEYMDGFESEEEFFLDDLEYMQSMADNAGVSLSTFLSEQALRTGDSGPIEFRNLKQATDYYVYAYGLTSLGIKTTPISRQVFRTSAPGESDLTLEIISIEVESNSAVVSVVPYYAFACPIDIECNVVGAVTVAEFTTGSVPMSDNVITFEPSEIGVNYAYIDVIPSNDDPFVALLRPVSDYEGMSGDDIIASVMDYYGDNIVYMMNTGEGTLSDTDLEEAAEYMAFAFGLDYGQATTGLFKYEFTTLTETDPSDMTFTFKVENVFERGADVYVYPEPITGRYYWNLVEGDVSAQEAEALVISDYEYYAEIGYVTSLVEYMEMVAYTGDAYSHFGTLDSDTEYKPFAVGIYSETGKFATDVFFGETFRTKVMTYADVHVTFDAENYYDGTDVASMYPVYYEAVGMAVLPVSVSTQGNAVNYYYHMFEGDLSDPDYISDERITDELFPKGIENDPYYVFLGYWGETVTLLGVAEDEAGNFGPVTRQVITFDRSGVSDITGFKPESVRGAAPEKIAPEVGLYRR